MSEWWPIKSDIDPKNIMVGEVHEGFYARRLKSDVMGKEKPIYSEIGGIATKGKMDFEVITKNGDKVIIETKATLSKKTAYSVITRGNVKLNQLAQLVFYMIHEKVNKGKLVVGFYEEVEENMFRQLDLREFKVTFNKQGQILVDGIPYEFDTRDQTQHQILSRKVIKEEIMWERPEGSKSYISPCKFCQYQVICNKWDLGEYKCREDIEKGEGDKNE